MKKRINSTVCRLIILIVLISSPVFAEDWKVLFDGKTLTGWTERSKERCFEVVDGQIVGTMVLNKGTSLLCTDAEFADFELELEVKILTPDLNSGINIRSRAKENQQFGGVYGPHVELSTKTANTRSGLIYGSGWKGWITPKETEGNTFMKRGEWNVIRVRAVGKSVKTWINGKFVIEQVIPDNRHETNSKGFVALQCADKHGIKPDLTCKIAFKNIRIREIASSARK
jgi:hypothetical protein